MNKITFEKFVLSNYSSNPIVTDSKIALLYNICGDNVYILPQGEQAKSFKYVSELCSWFLRRHVSPQDTVVAVGGGSIGDTVGFATSIYKRGIGILHVPTTLIAQIDSSVGGKTAIDLDGVKNAVGTYHYGDTLIDVDFLKTLDDEQRLSGLGEIFKYRMLNEDIDKVYDSGNGALADVVKACVKYKKHVCDSDPGGKQLRLILNFGHTVGHAMELTQGISHGVAVANGIYYETKLAKKMNVCTSEYADKWMKEVERHFPIYPIDERTLSLTLNDKKNAHSNVCVILPNGFIDAYFILDDLKGLLLHD